MADRSVTIAEIAAEAGVSVPTVSKVLNGRKGVSPRTRAQVEQLLAEHGYQRRRRTGRRSGLVDFVISSLDTQWAAALLRGAQHEAARLGVDLVVTTTHGNPVGSPDWLDHLAERGSDGVVLVVSRLLPAASEELARLHMPVVLVDPVGSGDPSMATVAATDWAGARDATDHLIGLGHRRIRWSPARSTSPATRTASTATAQPSSAPGSVSTSPWCATATRSWAGGSRTASTC